MTKTTSVEIIVTPQAKIEIIRFTQTASRYKKTLTKIPIIIIMKMHLIKAKEPKKALHLFSKEDFIMYQK